MWLALTLARFFPEMKIHFLGALSDLWMSGWQRFQTLRQLGQEVLPMCQSTHLAQAMPSRWQRLLGAHSFNEAALLNFNREWLRTLVTQQPNVAWLEWPKLLLRETIEEGRSHVPHCRFIAFYDDNPFGTRAEERWQWELFFEAIPEFDLCLVKRPSDIDELRHCGAKRAELFMHGCFTPLFQPLSHQTQFAHEVSFVGTALDHRVPFVERLIARERIPLRVFGHRWERTCLYHLRRAHFRPAVLGEDYAEVLRSSRLNLGFVSSSNHDEYTMRTFEIPACRSFLLAERTPTHQALFEEGREAEFFSSVEECADKARHYLRNESGRARIAEAGYRRCIEADYSLKRRLHDALAQIETLAT